MSSDSSPLPRSDKLEDGNPFTAIEPLLAEGEDGLDQSLRVEWEEGYKAENIRNFLSK